MPISQKIDEVRIFIVIIKYVLFRIINLLNKDLNNIENQITKLSNLSTHKVLREVKTGPRNDL